jgi:hypothetical protein
MEATSTTPIPLCRARAILCKQRRFSILSFAGSSALYVSLHHALTNSATKMCSSIILLNLLCRPNTMHGIPLLSQNNILRFLVLPKFYFRTCTYFVIYLRILGFFRKPISFRPIYPRLFMHKRRYDASALIDPHKVC